MIYQSFGNFRGSANLPVHAPIRSAEIMQRPIRNAIVEFFLELAPARDRPLVRDTTWEKQIGIIAAGYAFQNSGNNIPVGECVLLLSFW